MKKPIVFSLVREQSLFMTIIMSLLTFLSVLALGISISIATGVIRWNAQWDLFATVQITSSDNISETKKILTSNSDRFETVTEISTEQMHELMSPWLTGGGAMEQYLPAMYEVRFKTHDDMEFIQQQIAPHARFLTHTSALKSPISAGWKMIFISIFLLILTLGAIGICISYIARNTAMLHKRELEILNQIGASDKYVARQMQFIVTKICASASLIGFICASPILLLILSAAHSARMGLMSMLNISSTGWTALFCMPIFITIFAIYITRHTTLKILKNS